MTFGSLKNRSCSGTHNDQHSSHSCYSWLNLLNDLADQIVFVGLGDLDVVDGPDLRVEVFGDVVDKDVAVDLLSLAFEPTLEEEGRFLRKALENNGVGVADLCEVKLFTDLCPVFH